MERLNQIIEFLHLSEKLKSTIRANHLTNGDIESTADHCWRLALMVLIFSKEINSKINVLHAVKMAIYHDISESITGDYDAAITMKNPEIKKQKTEEENQAMQKIKEMLPKDIGEEIEKICNEYDEGKSIESKFVKTLDKLKGVMQYIECNCNGFKNSDIMGLYGNNELKSFPDLQNFAKLLKIELKNIYKEGNIKWEENFSI